MKKKSIELIPFSPNGSSSAVIYKSLAATVAPLTVFPMCKDTKKFL